MADADPPVVRLPAPVDRRLRLGPFASARDALKFVTYAAAGAVLAPLVSPFAWLPVVAAGFVLSAWRPDGDPWDERAARWVAWRGRQLLGGAVGMPVGPRDAGSAFVRLGPGRYATILRSSGTPLAYRPPAELERMFREYGELLRGSDGVLAVRAGAVPLDSGSLIPPPRASADPNGVALSGYRELVEMVGRRRLVRRVDLILFSSTTDLAGSAHLDARTRSLAAHLDRLGLTTVRLRGRSLREAAHRLGWSTPRDSA